MEETSCAVNSACEDINYEPNFQTLNCKESNNENHHTACINTNGPIIKEILVECDHCSEIKGPANEAQLEDIDSVSYEDNAANSVGISACMESGPSVSLENHVEKYLCRFATYPSSKSEFMNSFCMEGNAEFFTNIGGASSEGNSIDQFSTYKRSVSLPAPSSLVSAMKGGRAEKGMAMTPGIRVKWAPDVYDPPTSCSVLQLAHSNNRQRSKPKKKDKLRHKHAKGKFAKQRPS